MYQALAVEVNTISLGDIETLADVFALAINIVLGIGIALTIIYLILGGIQYITSKGDQKAAQEARTSLTNAVIGFIVVIGAFTIRTIVVSFLEADLGNQDERVLPKF
uniref:Uncharacterized protein n=1 Tax=candidate division WWE3 bacterium TaxID=2053526 RepID=A0A7C4TP56_UNCKA